MKRNSLFFLCIVFLLLFMAMPTLAEDGIATNTPVAGLSVEPAEVEAAATVEATAPAPVIINVEQPPVTAPAADDNFTEIVLLVSNVIAYGIILAQAVMQNGSVNRKTLDSFFAGLKGLGRFIPGEKDDKFIAGMEAAANAYLGERPPENPALPATPTGSIG